MAWDTVIGLEVHAQLQTQSKLFSGAATKFGAAPNSQTCFIDAALPGVLPVVNQQAIIMAIQFGFAIDAEINNPCYFERKNYFYPDLPKGYQISQYQKPIVANGSLMIELEDGRIKPITIVRAHLEEDAGKLLHDQHPHHSNIDLNRAGIPLLEIVTAPCLFSAEEAVVYLKALHQLLRFLGICDGNMQEGAFRCDVNISLKPTGSSQLGTRTELKNLNSFRFIEKAIHYEQARQQELLEQGQLVHQETRLYCPTTNTTQALRSKENENDYRYFPDPDLLPIYFDQTELTKIKLALPLLPAEIKQEMRQKPSLHQEDIDFLLASPANYTFFQAVKKTCQADEKIIINWLKGPYAAGLHEKQLDFSQPPIPASALATLLNALDTQTLSNNRAKQIFKQLWAGEDTLDALLAQAQGVQEDSDEQALMDIIQALLIQYPQQVADYRAGKEKLLAFFVGQVMKATKGNSEPERISQLLTRILDKN